MELRDDRIVLVGALFEYNHALNNIYIQAAEKIFSLNWMRPNTLCRTFLVIEYSANVKSAIFADFKKST